MSRSPSRPSTALCLSLLVVAATSGWNAQATGRASAMAPAFFAVLVATSLAAGALAAAWLPRSLDRFSMRLLCGFLMLDLAVYAVVSATPSRMVFACVISIAALSIAGIVTARKAKVSLVPQATAAEAVAVGASLVAITLWCQDYLAPIQVGPAGAVVNAWQDVFFHLRILSALAHADGMQSVSDLTMAGVPAHLYHYASYMAPAALVAAGAANALEAFASFMVPFGMLLGALAAFALLASVFGEWPAAAGTLLLLLAPDATQQGFGNQLLSYHWLQAVAPGGLHGVAVAALAWLLMLEACRARSWPLVSSAWAVALVSVAFKAHVFVAIAYPILLFPAIFMPGVGRVWRAAFIAGATAIFAMGVIASQSVPEVPLMRLDASGVEPYARLLLSAQPESWIKPLLQTVVAMPDTAARFAAFSAVLLLLTLGLWALVYPLLARKVARERGMMAALFPFLVMIVYVTMSAGLALDAHQAGQPEELLHRPFVWAYFVVCGWTGAAVYIALLGENAPVGAARYVALAMLVASLGVPAYFGRDLQSIPAWMARSDGIHLPACLVKAAWHIRERGSPHDLVQASDNDPRAQLSGLAERQAFAIDAANRMGGSPAKNARLKELAALRNLTEERSILDAMRRHSIAWYVLVPAQGVHWPAALERHMDYKCDGYKVYRFEAAARMPG